MEIHISNWTHKFKNKTGLDAKANSELYKSNLVCSVGNVFKVSFNVDGKIAINNEVEQGLSSSLFTRDLGNVFKVSFNVDGKRTFF
jgi:hypothetical protein